MLWAATGTGGNFECLHLGADLLAQNIDRHALPIALELPIGPAIAAWRPLKRRTDLMDRPFDVICDKRAISAYLRRLATGRYQRFARTQVVATCVLCHKKDSTRNRSGVLQR